MPQELTSLRRGCVAQGMVSSAPSGNIQDGGVPGHSGFYSNGNPAQEVRVPLAVFFLLEV